MKLDRTKPEHALYFRVPCRFGVPATLRVTALCFSEAEAHEHMGLHPDDSVIACVGPVIVLADKNDRGVGRNRERKR